MIKTTNIKNNPFTSKPVVKDFEKIANNLILELGENNSNVGIAIQFVNEEGSFDGSVIYLPSSLDSYKKHGGANQYEMFLTYFKHELVHNLTYKFWRKRNGIPPAFINEGIAQYLAEYFFIKKVYGFGYDELINCFLIQDKYIPLEVFLASDRFLEFRKDPRVLIENASFIGYLWRELGKEKFKNLFSKSKNPVYGKDIYFNLKEDFEGIYGKGFEVLESDWIRSIEGLGKIDRECVEFSKGFEKKELVFKSERCPYCFGYKIDVRTCPSCGVVVGKGLK